MNKENRKIDAEKTNFTALLLQVIASCGLIKGTTQDFKLIKVEKLSKKVRKNSKEFGNKSGSVSRNAGNRWISGHSERKMNFSLVWPNIKCYR